MIRFILGVHNHQPVGNFDSVFQEAFEKAYRPFLDVAEDYPTISLMLHFSGPLLEWFEEHEPGFLDRIAHLVKRGNVELFSGGFYEPILAAIPDHDKIGQIEKMNDYILQRFGIAPEGLWLTERVWEPHLARPIRQAGIKYVTVDDYHFLSAGIDPSELTGYFLTEEQNSSLGVFPISQQLRYTIPFKDPQETIDILAETAASHTNPLLVMADDGEKFGLWPGTHSLCYAKEKWLDRFFKALADNSDWIHTTTFNEEFRNSKSKGRIYLPTASYFEMSQWSLPATAGERFNDFVQHLEDLGGIDEVRPFIRGGTWRNFLTKYPESNWMQKRAFQVSMKLKRASEKGGRSDDIVEARNALWRSQCNCAYWHGIFGGLYLPHLRHAVYTNLIAAESMVNSVDKGISTTIEDVNLDGEEEVIITTPQLRSFFTPTGGSIQELDVLPAKFNLVNTLRRHLESYHRKIHEAGTSEKQSGSIHDAPVAKEQNLEKYLQVDNYPRSMLLDHFFPKQTTLNDLQQNAAAEKGEFLQARFDIREVNGSLVLRAKQQAFDLPVELIKTVHPSEDALTIDIQLMNQGNDKLIGLYGLEFNFSLLGGHTPDRYYLVNGNKPDDPHLDAVGVLSDVEILSLVTEWEDFQVDLEFGEPVQVWRFPISTVSLSESGFERVYQSSVVMPVMELSVEPGNKLSFDLILRAYVRTN